MSVFSCIWVKYISYIPGTSRLGMNRDISLTLFFFNLKICYFIYLVCACMCVKTNMNYSVLLEVKWHLVGVSSPYIKWVTMTKLRYQAWQRALKLTESSFWPVNLNFITGLNVNINFSLYNFNIINIVIKYIII